MEKVKYLMMMEQIMKEILNKEKDMVKDFLSIKIK